MDIRFCGRSDFSFRLRAGCERKRENNVPYQRRNENRMEQGKISPYCGEPELPREKERQVFYSPPKRVAAVWQNSIETLLALGVGDRIIAGMGVPDRKYIREEYQAGYEAIPYKSLENLDPETIMMMRPDFIAGWSSTFTDKVLRSTEFWNERGVHTYISPNSAPANRNRTIENEYADILNLGKIFDRKKKRKALSKK